MGNEMNQANVRVDARVDVLAVLTRGVNRLVCAWDDAAPGDTGPEPPVLQEARAARAAVAELIEAAEGFRAVTSGDDAGSSGQSACARLDAALARIGGAA